MTRAEQLHFADYASVSTSQVTFYSRPINKSFPHNNSLLNLKSNDTKNKLSQKASKRCANTIRWFINARISQLQKAGVPTHLFHRKIGFWTLTLAASQVHTDNEIKSVVLNQFLVEMRRHGLKRYIWKAEKQENGNIHFHIVTDVYVHYLDVRKVWNRCQEKLGYVSRFLEKHGHKHSSPPSANVTALKSIKNIADYIAKYCSKDGKGIEGRIWFASETLQGLSNVREFVNDHDFRGMLYAMRKKHCREFITDYSTTFFFSFLDLVSHIPQSILSLFNSIFNRIMGDSPPAPRAELSFR